MPTPRKRPMTKSGRPRARKGVKLKPTELGPPQLRLEGVREELKELAGLVEAGGGSVLAAYREPLGGNALLFAALPVDKVEPTSYQRDVSDAHVLKLTRAMDKTRSEEHTSELQSPCNLVCRLLLEKKKKRSNTSVSTNTQNA